MHEAHTGRLAYLEQELWIPALVQSRGVRNVLPRHDFTGCVLTGPAVMSLIDCDLQNCRVVGALQVLPLAAAGASRPRRRARRRGDPHVPLHVHRLRL